MRKREKIMIIRRWFYDRVSITSLAIECGLVEADIEELLRWASPRFTLWMKSIILALMLAPVAMGQAGFVNRDWTGYHPCSHAFRSPIDEWCKDYIIWPETPWTTPEPVLDQHWEPLHPLVDVEDNVVFRVNTTGYGRAWIDDPSWDIYPTRPLAENQRIAGQISRFHGRCVDVMMRHTYTIICEKEQP